MSYYNSHKLLQDWAEKYLKQYLAPAEYPKIFAALRSPRRSDRLSRVELGILKILLEDYRPERGVDEQKRYAESMAIKLSEIADALHSTVSTVRKARKRINRLVKAGALDGSGARKHGLILFHGMGTMIKATFWDAVEAKRYSEVMGDAQLETHGANAALADEKRHDIKLRRDRVEKFNALSPAEQDRLLAQLEA